MNQSQMPTVVLDSKKIAELETSIPVLAAQAHELQVADEEDYLASGSLLDLIHERQKKLMEFFEEPAKQANNVHKFITSLRATLLMPLQQSETVLKNRRRDWREAEERKRLEKEEKERQAAKEEAEHRALEEAAKMQEIGEHEAADTIIERAAIAPPPPVVVPSTVPKEQGHSLRKVFKYRVTNPALHKKEFLVLDESKVQAVVSKLGPDAVSIVGGIEVYQEEIETIRGRK